MPSFPPIRPLDDQHDRAAFTCGIPALDRYLQTQAGQDMRRKVTNVFVMTKADSAAVLGYYTLSATTVEPTQLPPAIARRLPRYPALPATLIGRLAIHQERQGQGLGDHLMMDALYRCWLASRQVATLAVVVDIKDEAARPFYRRYDFQDFAERPRSLFLPMATVDALFATQQPLIDAINASYAALRADPAASTGEQSERAAWDSTLMDGLTGTDEE